MGFSLSHIAEDVFAAMVNAERSAFLRTSGLEAAADRTFVQSVSELATCEAQFEPVGGRSFDGACRVDVVVRVRPGEGVAFELKLGNTRLTKTRVDKEWLKTCVPSSHKDNRWSGNVLAVLDRRIHNQDDVELVVRTNGERLRLIRPWYFVARRAVLNAWSADPPSFSPNVRQLPFEQIVASFGGPDSFNQLVRKMVNIDYFTAWGLNEAG